jgi:hypothetical protein
MWIGVILMCASPVDARTCDVLVRTSNTFPTLEACTSQVRDDLSKMGLQNIYTRYKCYEMQQRSI